MFPSILAWKLNYVEKYKADVKSLIENHKDCIKNKVMLKTKWRFKRKRHNVFVEEITKIALSSNDDKRLWSIDLVEPYAYGKVKIYYEKKNELKCRNISKTKTLIML